MATIPELRARLVVLAKQFNSQELLDIADELRRRPVRRRAPVTSQPSTPEVRARIRQFVQDNPDLSQVAVAREFGVNPGRVSEAIRGKRR